MSEMRKDIDTLLDQHNEIFRSFRESSAAFDTAVAGLKQSLRAVSFANQHQEAAIDAALAANQAALRILRADSGE